MCLMRCGNWLKSWRVEGVSDVVHGFGEVCTTACTDRRPAPTSEPYDILRDGGGQIISAEADRARLLAWGGQVRIREYCASSCVIFTTFLQQFA